MVEQLAENQCVARSTRCPYHQCVCNSVGRVSAFQAECREFEPLRTLQTPGIVPGVFLLQSKKKEPKLPLIVGVMRLVLYLDPLGCRLLADLQLVP